MNLPDDTRESMTARNSAPKNAPLLSRIEAAVNIRAEKRAAKANGVNSPERPCSDAAFTAARGRDASCAGSSILTAG